MSLIEIKRRIRNEQSINKLLISIGCEYVKLESSGKLISAQLPEKFNSNNKRAVQVRLNNSMSCYIRNRNDFKGDIFSLISYIHFDKRNEDELSSNLPDAKNYICKILGIPINDSDEVIVKDYTNSLRELLGEERKIEYIPNEVIPEETLNNYLKIPSFDWKNEMISYKTQHKYGVGFDLYSKRITIPIRNLKGQLVGVKGRILNDEDSDGKYIYLHPCNISQEWFNYHIALEHIINEKIVYIFEGEKSCMKLFDTKIYNCLAIGSSSISEVQVKLLNDIGKDIKIILCYDSDKTIDEIKASANVFGDRDVYSLYDINGILGEKSSPIDEGIDVFMELVKNHCYKVVKN